MACKSIWASSDWNFPKKKKNDLDNEITKFEVDFSKHVWVNESAFIKFSKYSLIIAKRRTGIKYSKLWKVIEMHNHYHGYRVTRCSNTFASYCRSDQNRSTPRLSKERGRWIISDVRRIIEILIESFVVSVSSVFATRTKRKEKGRKWN